MRSTIPDIRPGTMIVREANPANTEADDVGDAAVGVDLDSAKHLPPKNVACCATSAP